MVLGFAALPRFVIAGFSEPRSMPRELRALVPILNEGGREFATFSALARRPNVAPPTVRYQNAEDLAHKLESEIVPVAEASRERLLPKG